MRHNLMELLLVAICAVLSGTDGCATVVIWGQAKQLWLRQLAVLISNEWH
ncbi:MAG: transposase family protein [Methylobacter sp.]|nr:transposase family protein [Methylobacter sp.]